MNNDQQKRLGQAMILGAGLGDMTADKAAEVALNFFEQEAGMKELQDKFKPVQVKAIDPLEDYPTEIKIGGKVWTVGWTQEDWDYLCTIDAKAHHQLGATKTMEMKAWIFPGQSIHQKRDTLLHELLHMVFRDTVNMEEYVHSDEREESIVQSLAPWLLTVIRENPKLLAWLTLP